MSQGAEQTAPSGLFRFLFVDTTFASLAGILVLLGGLMAYSSMIMEADPDLEIPMALVKTQWPGASTELVEREITNVIEKEIKTVSRVKSFTSTSLMGLSTIIVQFEADAPMESSIRALRTKVSGVTSLLPEAAKAPAVEHISTTDTPVLTYILHGSLPEQTLSNSADKLKKVLERQSSIRKVEILGAKNEEVRILIDPVKLNAYGLTLSGVNNTISQASLDRPLGRFIGGPLEGNVGINGRFTSLEEIKRLPLKRLESGGSVRLEHVAEVERGLEFASNETMVSFDGKPLVSAVTLQIFKTPGSDTVKLVDEARAMVEAIKLPAGAELSVISDQSVQVKSKVTEVFVNGVEAVIAVVLVLILMMSWREAVIAGLAIPVTFMAALIVLYGMGMTLNTIVIIGMVLALGLLVDVFILVMEGMHQGIKSKGLGFVGAAQYTVKTYALPAFAGQLTTILALAPLLFMGGTSGKFIRLIPLTAIICLVASYVIAFVWAIPMSKYVLGNLDTSKQQKTGVVDKIMGGLEHAVIGILNKTFVAKKALAYVWIGITLVLVVISFMFAGQLKMQMYPKEDGSDIGITVQLPRGTSLEESKAQGIKLAEALIDKPYVSSTILYAGKRSPYAGLTNIGNPEGPNVIGFTLKLVPLEARNGQMSFMLDGDIRQTLDPLIEKIPGAILSVNANTGGQGSTTGFALKLKGEDLKELDAASQYLAGLLQSVEGANEVNSDLAAPEYTISGRPRRESLDYFGISLGNMAQELSLAMSLSEVTKLKTSGLQDDIPIKMGVSWPGNDHHPGVAKQALDLSNLKLRSADGTLIPVSNLIIPMPGALPPVIHHDGGERSVTVRANFSGPDGDAAVGAVAQQIGEISTRFPGVQIALGGSAKEQAESNARMMQLFLLTLVLMFSTLVLLFNSYRLPFIIIFAIPFALIGTFFGFYAIDMALSFPAMVGIVSLLGIVVNVSIVLVETMLEHKASGMSIQEAAVRGAADRLRPILSTSMTTIAGLALLSFSSPMWQPLCLAIIFGLLAATIISIFIIPCLFLILTPASNGTEGEAS